MATAKLASDLSSDSEKPESGSSVRTGEIYSWAGQLASENRELKWVWDWYVWPDAVLQIFHRLKTMNGGIIGLVGLQGVGKSSALTAILGKWLLDEEFEEFRSGPELGRDIIRFKMRRKSELFSSLLVNAHEASSEYCREYFRGLMADLKARFRPPLWMSEELEGLEGNPERLNRVMAEKTLGKSATHDLQEVTWVNMLLKKKVILIDTPDYSKTDRRLMAKDLDEIYWLWNLISQGTTKPNIVVAIQKEMFRGHFFFDKMEKFELEPLRAEQMVEAYGKRFKGIEPFTEDALLTLARMSRGIFRRFLRYITLTLRHWEVNGEEPIDTAIVKEAVTVARLAEDMELELVELFPKQSDLRLQAVKLLMLLEESGPRKQNELGEELGLEAYEMSRLLAKLELHHFIARRREGTDKVVSLGTR